MRHPQLACRHACESLHEPLGPASMAAPEKRPSRGLLAGVRLRMRAVRLAKESGVAFAVGFTGCSRASIYRWIQAFEKGGITALVEDSRRPQHLRTTVPNWVDTVIIAIRLNTYWNSKRIAAEMARREIYRVSAKHIDRLFHQLGCSRGSVPPQAGPRYERSTPNELWHIDIKGPFFINVEGAGYLKTWIVGLVDDHSRFVLASGSTPTPSSLHCSNGWTIASSSGVSQSN